jgi:hypothetical protein
MAEATRAHRMLPNVLLTLLSVVQALALEALWSAIRESPVLFAGGIASWVSWLQVTAIFQGIIVIWLFYIGVVMRYSWIPSTRDSVAPFVLGAGELSMVQLIGPDLLHYWFATLAAVFCMSAWVSRAMFLAAFADPLNPQVEIASDEGFVGRWNSWIAAAVILACGGSVWWAGGASALGVGCLLLANAILAAQGFIIQHFWRQWVGTLQR